MLVIKGKDLVRISTPGNEQNIGQEYIIRQCLFFSRNSPHAYLVSPMDAAKYDLRKKGTAYYYILARYFVVRVKTKKKAKHTYVM